MRVFVVVHLPAKEVALLQSAIARLYPGDSFQLASNVWLVADNATAMEVSGKLQITGGENGSAIITEMGDYYGRAGSNIWAWIKAKRELVPGA
jgi:hypothetical protein